MIFLTVVTELKSNLAIKITSHVSNLEDCVYELVFLALLLTGYKKESEKCKIFSAATSLIVFVHKLSV